MKRNQPIGSLILARNRITGQIPSGGRTSLSKNAKLVKK